jgi:hypothetical protein
MNTSSGSYTLVKYSYTDAGNYKFYGEFVLSGVFVLKEISIYLIDEEYFIPSAIGLPSLVPLSRNSDDHMLHEFLSATPTDVAMADCFMYKKKLINLARTAKNVGWFRNLNPVEFCY